MIATRVVAINPEPRVLELGSRDVNGSPRGLVPATWAYTGLDQRPGPGVDVFGDAASWRPADGRHFELVICAEVLEHCPHSQQLLENAYALASPGGVLLVTAAGPCRPPHGCDGGPVGRSEWYQGVSEGELRRWLYQWGLVLSWDRHGQDVYALAVK